VVLLAYVGENFPEASVVTAAENPLVWLGAVQVACPPSV
jgi:hypothetical protein